MDMKRNLYLILLAALLPVLVFAQRTINVSKAGTLPTLISDSEKYTIEELTLTGKLNGTDLRLLRDMAGNNYKGELTEGKLSRLDLSDASIVEGGENYLDCYQIFLDVSASMTDERGFIFSSVKNAIPQWLFVGCNSLREISLPTGTTAIGDYAFAECMLTKITIPSGIVSIGERAFYHNMYLTTFSMPSALKTIGANAFTYCSGLTGVEIPASVSEIGKNAFSNCKALESVRSFMTQPCSITEKTFTVYDKATLYVPAGAKALYEATEAWNSFKSIAGITVKVKLNKTKATLEKGKTVTLKATLSPADLAEKSVTWKSSNKKVATVSSKGKVKAVKAGTATITCTSKMTGAKATCKVTVINGTVTLSETELFIEKGTKKTLEATVTPTTLEDKSVTWTTSNKKIATVSSTGKVKGVKYGTATITCTCVATGVSATCKVTVGDVVLSKSEVSVKKGKTTKLTATVYPTTLEDQSVTWTTSNKKIATVSSSGKVKGIKAGTVTITCTSVATGLSATCTVTVVSASTTRSLEGNDDDETTGIEDLEAEPAETEPFDVYDLSGRKVLSHVTSLDGLPNGVYIVNGKKMLKK